MGERDGLSHGGQVTTVRAYSFPKHAVRIWKLLQDFHLDPECKQILLAQLLLFAIWDRLLTSLHTQIDAVLHLLFSVLPHLICGQIASRLRPSFCKEFGGFRGSTSKGISLATL